MLSQSTGRRLAGRHVLKPDQPARDCDFAAGLAMIQPMRIAWFSPLPPERSGIAAYSADLVPRLAEAHAIDCFTESNAGDFLWKRRREPYDLVVYQLGNAPCHDYMWAYLAAFPGLVVLHDARLHQSRARSLLKQRRFDDYRREFAYDHPDARRDFAEYAVEGLGGPIYYFWSMLRVVMRTARLVAVPNPRVAADLREAFPGAAIEAIHLGTAPLAAGRRGAAARVRAPARRAGDDAVLFAAFGKITAEKRIGAILRAFDAVAGERRDVHLLLAGDASDYPALERERSASAYAARVHVSGYLPDQAIGDYLAASDVCLCLRWPTALETSASWLQCLAAARPTVISDLAHLADIPALDPRSRRASPGAGSTHAGGNRDRSAGRRRVRCAWRCAGWPTIRCCARRWDAPGTPTGRRTTRSRRWPPTTSA